MVVVVDAGLAGVELGGGIHWVRPSLRLRVVQPVVSMSLLSAGQASESVVMSVGPSAAAEPSPRWASHQ